MTRVLVTDGAERSALAAVRSLGRAGYTVLAAAGSTSALALGSRWCSEGLILPDPLASPDAFARQLAAIAAQRRVDVVLPVTDAAVLAVLSHRAAFGSIVVPSAGLDAFARVSDKGWAVRTAPSLGIAVPRQVELASAADAPRLDPLTFPVVVKPARSVAGSGEAQRRHPVVHASSVAELHRVLTALPPSAWPVLVQERVLGPGVGVFLLVWNGMLLAAFMHQRLREKPPSGGVSVLAESIPPDQALIERSRALVETAGWQGVAMIEYKRDEVSGVPVLMEINGRFWGSLQLAIDAGVDFPRLLLEAVSGRPVTPVMEWRTGVRGRWFWGDMDHCLARLRSSAASLHLPASAPGRLRTLAAVLGESLRGAKGQVFRADDPGPALRELSSRLAGLWR